MSVLSVTTSHEIASIGYMIMAASIGIWIVNLIYAFTAGKKAPANPWGPGAFLPAVKA